ncbi:hypothetical protein IJH06_01775 [Candidatus Saccharibacteria bacterium]|nr:hypothetical protein [Candidatus Saccharibacteria bacterium]
MKKKLSFCFALILMIGSFGGLSGAKAISVEQEEVIMERCNAVKNALRVVQREDSRVRFYLGRYYETILTKFVTPLNTRLAANTMLSTEFTANQNDLAKTRANFVIDYIEYQKGLEELATMDCQDNPSGFYAKLTRVRERRAVVADDVVRMQDLIDEHYGLVVSLKEEI